ncbi:hypothetical protein ACFS4T_22425 [Pseudomonas lini]
MLRDYRRMHHHIAALAYPLLERAGERSVENIDLVKENPSKKTTSAATHSL